MQAEDLDPALGGRGDEAADEVAADRPRAHEEAAAQRHRERRLRALVERADPLPRALDAAADGRVEDAAAGDLEVGESGHVEHLGQPQQRRPSASARRAAPGPAGGSWCRRAQARGQPSAAHDPRRALGLRRVLHADSAWLGLVKLRARDVAALARVDLDPVAHVHEQRHLHDRAGLEGRGLRHVRDRVAADAGLGLGDGQLDGRRAAARPRAARRPRAPARRARLEVRQRVLDRRRAAARTARRCSVSMKTTSSPES